MKPMEIIKRWWQEAAPVARAAIIVGVAAILGSIAYFLTTTSVDRPLPLFVGMNASDASSLAQELEQRGIPFELQDNGTTLAVRVPQDEMRKLRLELSTDGLPGGRVTGWDIFDDSSVTLTEFERKVMYQRALQGELARTIAELPQVRSARVHLALPTKSLLERETGEPSASVYVSLERGRTLSAKVASGIANLVASSVPDLSFDRIGIMDGDGTMIREPDDGQGGGRKVLEIKESRERTLERDIVDLLEKTVGPGHVIAKVEVDMDLARVEETQEQYDPDNATLRSERKTTEGTSSERNRPTAIAGTAGNLPQVPAQGNPSASGEKSESNREIDSREFAVPRTVRQVSKPLGDLRKMSIAVLVDTNPFTPDPGPAPADEEDEGTEAVDVPPGVESPGGPARAAPPPPQPSPEMLAALVKSAVGFDDGRGDRIEISFVPFVRPDTVGGDEVQYVESPIAPWMWVLITLLAGVVLVAGALWVTEKRRREAAIADYARQLQEKEDLLQKQKEEEDGAVPNSARLRTEVRDITNKNVAATVEVMKSWLRPTLGRN